MEQAGQGRDTVGHGHIDDLSPTRGPGGDDGSQQPHDGEHRAAAIVADQVQRRRRRPVARPHGVQHAAEADVVQVVADLIRQRPLLAPAGDAAEHQSGVGGLQRLGAVAQPLHHAGAEAFDHRIGRGGQGQDAVAVRRGFQVDRNRRTAAVQDRPAHLVEHSRPGRGRAGQAQHLGAQVCQHHAGEGDGAQAVEFQDAQAGEGLHPV